MLKQIIPCILSLVTLSGGQYGLENLGTNIENTIRNSLRPLDNLGSRINENVNRQLSGLNNLGSQIQQQVYEGLEPVRALESLMRVRFGTDGTTIVTFSPSGRKFIVQNGEYYTCTSTINEANGQCSGTLEKLQFQKNEDYCFVTSKSIINNQYCIVPNGNYQTISVINGHVICEAAGNVKALLISVQEYNNMCRNVANNASYKFITYNPVKHIGHGVQCSGNNPQVCTYNESLNNNNPGSFQSIITG